MTNYELAEKDYMLGMKYKDIAAKYGVGIDTVKKWKTRYKWERPPKKKPSTNKCRQQKKVDNDKRGQNVPAVISRESDGLTEKQRLFCLYYIKNFNATQSYLKAYGGSYDVANAEGYKLLVKPCVKAEIDRLKEIKRQSINITEDDIVERYMRIAFADITDFADFGTEEVPEVDSAGQVILNPDGTVMTRKYNYMNFKDSNQVDGGLICEISQGRSGMKVKLSDSQRALAWLSDYFNMNPMNKHRVAYDNAVLAIRDKELKLKEW